MGLFSKLFKKESNNNNQLIYADYINGRTPIYSQFGENIYASDVVQQAIYSIVSELKKLDPVHVRKIQGESILQTGNIQSVLEAPNPLMTTSDFIEKISWTLLLNYNCFIYPIWNGDKLQALYPLQPSTVSFLQDNKGKLYVEMRFNNGYVAEAIPYENLIHLRYKYSVSEYMGGDENGQPNNRPLLDTLKLNDTLLKGLAKSLNMQTTVNGVIKIKTMANMDDQLKKVKEFEDKLQHNTSGLLPVDVTSEYVPINKQIAMLDATTLEFIDKKILRSFGVSIAIIDGDYTKEQYEAFYQKTLEPIIKSLGEAFTKGIFSQRQYNGFNNKIVFYAKELIFMNTEAKINLFNMLVDTGSCYKNELRTAFGLRPLAILDGQIAESSNKTNAENNKNNTGGVANE